MAVKRSRPGGDNAPVADLPRALLLDLDDTILDDSSTVESAWDRACAEAAAGAGLEAAALRAAVEVEKKWFWDDPERHRTGRLDLPAARAAIVRGALRRCGREDEALAAGTARRYAGFRREACRPFPGALEALAAFRGRGVRMALLTNGGSAMQRDKIARFGLAGFFDGIFVEGELGFGKPEERVFLLALDAVGVPPRDAWMVGDRLDWEVAPAKRLGMGAVWVDARGRGLPADVEVRPDRVVRGIAELLG
jgi:putative hydrolase of the HAD superfamily